MHPTKHLGDATGQVWTRRAALEVVSEGQLSRLVGRTWQSPWPGVYADAGFVLSPEQRAWAAVLASGGEGQGVPGRPVRSVASGRTAARLLGLLLVDDDDPATGAREHLLDDVSGWQHRDALRVGDAVLVRHQVRFGPTDLERTEAGLWVTSVERTLSDLTRVLAREAAVCLVDDALRRGLLTPGGLDALVASRRGRPGSGALVAVAAAADARAESPAETLARLLLRPHLPGLEPQVRVRDASGRVVARLDLGDRARRLGVELDGRRAHAGDAMVARDQRRDRATSALSWAVERGVWADVRVRQAEFVARVVRRARGRAA